MGNPVKLLSCFSPEEILPFLSEERHVIIIIDSNVKALYGNYFPYPQIEFEASETNKSLTQIGKLTEQLMEKEADRDTFVLAIGGGITTDVAGFVASVYFRGIRFGFVPTTLLAQVDASIGGKNGVNSNGFKNIIGTINQPEFTIMCSAFLKTLPVTDFKGGIAEMLKTFIIGDQESYFKAVEILKRAKERETKNSQNSADSIAEIYPFIVKAAAIKAAIVEKDMHETNERKLLNLGHTFAHAIEKESNTPHGHAVAAGIILAAKLSVKLSLLKLEEAQIIENDFKNLGLNTESPVPVASLVNAISKDKKRLGETITFILIEEIGKCFKHPIHIAKLKEILYDLS
ncbi:MAG: 3-dehydroquinate synthase family protein [Bacteroidales bacterium]